jgi:hypothetical protein
MRADSHYVDQLESRQAGPIVRLLSLPQIDISDVPPLVGLEALTRSIAAHGILQPLLVRRQNARYQLISGRKRLAAAAAAGLTEVPCVVHHVDEADARVLAEAENTRTEAGGESTQPLGYGDAVAQVLKAVSTELGTIASLANAVKPGGPTSLHGRVSADLLQAQTWRAAWLVSSTLAVRPGPSSRARSLSSILDRVKTGFEAEARLTRLRLDGSVAPSAAALNLDEELGVTMLTGCVLATLSWLGEIDEPRVDIRIVSPNQRAVRIEVVQRLVAAPPDAVNAFREPSLGRSGDLTAWLAVQAVKAIASRLGGSADFTPIGDRGTVIQVSLSRNDSN